MKVLKKGYKDTEVGVIPTDWQIRNIANSCSIKARIGWQGLTKSEYQKFGEFILITGTDFKNGAISWETCSFVSKYRYEQDRYIQVQIGDVLITKDGTIGKVASVNELPYPSTLNSGVFVVRPLDKDIDKIFLSLIFKSKYFDDFLDKLIAGSTINHLYQKDFVSFNFPIPSKQEQQAIAEALSDIDALINALNKQIEKKKNIKQGAMQELLTGKKRLQGFADKWEEITLEKIAGNYSNRFIDGDWIESPYIIDSGVRLIQTGNIGVGHFKENNNKRFISESSFNLLNCKEVFSGDILICRLAEPAGRACIVPDLKEKMITSVDVTIFRPLESLYDKYFISYIINTDKWFKDIAERCGGTTRTRIARSKLGTVKLMLPPTKEEQSAIAQILTDMDNEIEQLEKKRDKYLNIKSGMMQQLLTGQVRLINTTSCSEAQEAEIKNYSTDNKKKHSKQFDEAVIISFLVDKFGSAVEPLSRFMYTKLSYLIHRKHDCIVVDYKKFAAGPYNPKSRYGGPEKIGKENGYFDLVKNIKDYDAFIPQQNIQEAVDYFTQWYGTDIQNWIEQFRHYKPWNLETLATVDMAINDLEEKGVKATVNSVKTYLSSIPKWKAKLDKPHFSDMHIQRAINESIRLFKI